tara:strand:+ start:283 stop:861 length:579 start_codon:yes stop_codon:yes gene_type:complete
MDNDKELIDFHSRLDRPIPGEGLTSDPKSPWPWEKPPAYVSVIRASEHIFEKLTDEELHSVILDAMEDDIPVMDITRFILFQGFTEGLWNADLLLLLIEPTAYMLVALAERALIEPVVYKEEDQDELIDRANIATNEEMVDGFKQYSETKEMPKGVLSEEITNRIKELPEGRASLLDRPARPRQESLLERTA